MLETIVNYVNYRYQLCENIDSPFLSKDEKANECFIKSCLIYKYLHEIFGSVFVSGQPSSIFRNRTRNPDRARL